VLNELTEGITLLFGMLLLFLIGRDGAMKAMSFLLGVTDVEEPDIFPLL
jgi:hypothetical protein